MNDQTEISFEVVDREADDAVVAMPPRYWWLKRLGIACVLLLIGLVGLRLYWGWEADRRLQIQLDKYRADGQPVTPSEFDAQLDAVPDDENAAILLEKAMNKIVATATDGTSFEDFRDDPALFETNMPAAREIIEANAAVFVMVREGLAMPKVAWYGRLTNFFNSFNGNLLSQKRQLAKLIYFSTAFHAHNDEGTMDALVSLQMLLAFEQAVSSHPTLISNLLGISCGAIACNLVEEFGSLLTTHKSHSNQVKSENESRRLLCILIKRFLDDKNINKSFSYAVRGELGVWLDLILSYQSWKSGGPFIFPAGQATFTDQILYVIAKPLEQLEIMANLEQTTKLKRAASERSWLKAKSLFPKTSKPNSMIEWMVHPMRMAFGDQQSSIERSFFLYYKHLARRRMAATVLAIGLYEADHGQRPERLEQLVPKYLPAVPLDPFSLNDETIRYIPHDEHPNLYSVGMNGIDELGQADSYDDVEGYTYKSDILFYLDGKPKAKDKN